MSFQVGAFCYPSPGDAGRAACTNFELQTSIDGTNIRTVSCSGADPTTGALQLDVATTDISTNVVSSVQIYQPITFSECMQQDVINAVGILIGAALGVWAVMYGLYKVYQMLDNWRNNAPTD